MCKKNQDKRSKIKPDFTLFLVVLIIFPLFVSYAQQGRYPGDVEITPNMGYSASVIRGDQTSNYNTRNSTQYGVLIDYYFDDQWSVRTGISSYGMGAVVKDSATSVESDLKYNYTNIPINANWHFGDNRNWNLNFGLTPGLLIKAEFGRDDIENTTRQFHLGISYGLGYKLEVSRNFGFLIDGRGIYGITNIQKESSVRNYNTLHSINIGGVYSLF